MARTFSQVLFRLGAVGILASLALVASAQTPASAQQDLAAQIKDLTAMLRETQAELAQNRQETTQLKNQLAQLEAKLAGSQSAAAETTAQAAQSAAAQGPQTAADSGATETVAQGTQATAGAGTLEQRTSALEEQQDLLHAKIDDLYQTKVGSSSMYRVRLFGMLLFNGYADRGSVENADVPNLAMPHAAGTTDGNIGGTARQSEIGLQTTGPKVWGAQTSADIYMDFYGGFPNMLDGTAVGLARLTVARGRFDWQNTSLIFGVDRPFIAPLDPTSYASVGVPAFGYSGNLWTWAPQIEVEQRWKLGEEWHASLEAGILDPVSGQFPVSTSDRQPEPGESSRQPALAARAATGRTIFGREFSAGVGTYSSRQNYGYGRSVQAWAFTADWNVPVTPWLDASGAFFHGQALGGLWGGVGTSIVASGPLTNPKTAITPLATIGGWSQLKFRLTPKLELNTAYGEDNPYADDLEYFPGAQMPYTPISRNQTSMINLVDKPRSDLVLALEFRHIDTSWLASSSQTANQINTAIGVLF